MSLAAKLGVGFLALVALMAVFAAHQLYVVRELRRDSRQISQISFAALQQADRLRSQVAELEEFSDKFAVLRDREYSAALGEIRSEIEAGLARLRGLELSPEEAERLAELTLAWNAYREEIPPRDGRVLGGTEAADAYRREVAARLADLRLRLTALIGGARAAMASRARASEALARRSLRAAGWATAVAAIAAVGLSWSIYRSVAAPLARLVEATRVVAEGDFGHRVVAAGGPELSAVAQSFNEMADRLSELDRTKREFVGNLSHDLKAPLASMTEAIRFLLEEPEGERSATQERMLRLALESGRRLSELLQNLLDLARFDAGAIEYRRQLVDLRQVAEAALAGLGGAIEEAGVELTRKFPARSVPVEADPRFLSRAVQNLLSNAIKFTPRGGTAGVRLVAEDRRSAAGWDAPVATLEVWDSGPGIADERKTAIFRRFSAGGEARDGTGLGLAIVAAVIADHHGRVRVEDRPGGGSRFVVELPLAAGVAEAGGEA